MEAPRGLWPRSEGGEFLRTASGSKDASRRSVGGPAGQCDNYPRGVAGYAALSARMHVPRIPDPHTGPARRERPELPERPERIGLFGGSFDPVHSGHLHVARAALERFDLDRVVFVPARQSPHKLSRQLAPGEHRLAMLRLATASEPRFEVSDMELARPGPSFTVDTWRAFRAAVGADASAEIYLVLGSDNLSGLATWREARALLEGTQPIVIHRRRSNAGERGEDADRERVFAEIERDLGPVIVAKLRRGYVSLPPVDVSSTELRSRSPEALRTAHEIPAAVLAYIREHGLYGTTRA